MKAALIDNQNNVANVIVWDDTCTAPDGTTAVVLEDAAVVAPGWSYVDGKFVNPIPEEVIEP